jgi:hypothetical protein
MAAGSTTTTKNQMSPVNAALTNMFTGMMQGGAAQAGIGGLQQFASGQNINTLNTALSAANTGTFRQNVGAIRESFGSTGGASSSMLDRALATAGAQNAAGLTSMLAGVDVQAQQQQLQGASYLSQLFSGAANQYFTSQSSQQQQASGISTFMQMWDTLFKGYGPVSS